MTVSLWTEFPLFQEVLPDGVRHVTRYQGGTPAGMPGAQDCMSIALAALRFSSWPLKDVAKEIQSGTIP